MILKIVKHPDQILYTQTEALTMPEIKSSHTQTLIEDMIDTCKSVNGLGLAGPQVGIGKALFVYNSPKLKRFVAVINPTVISKKGRVTHHGEGCLSIPGKHFGPKRYKYVAVTALDSYGEEMILKSRTKMEAFILQHEIDHLNGITLINK